MTSPSLIIGTTYELTDYRAKPIIEQHSDLKIFKSIHGVIAGSWLVDRTKTISMPIHSKLLEEHNIPNFNDVVLTDLVECCVFRARELAALNKPIFLLWSGGIDSTAMLIGFMLAGISKSQINIVCNTNSLNENYKFYTKFIRNNYQIFSSEKLIQTLKFGNVDGVVVSAEHGDCMHGQDFGMDMLSLFGKEYLERPVTKENIIQFFLKNNIDALSAECWYDLFSTNIHLSPRPIITMYDWSWWIGYNWRWQWAGEKLKLRFAPNIPITTFFSSNEMQKWSVNHDQYDIKKLSDFKIDLKKLIFDFTNDQDYFLNKIKHISISFTYSSNAFVAIDETYTKIKANNYSILKYYQEDNFISQWLAAQ